MRLRNCGGMGICDDVYMSATEIIEEIQQLPPQAQRELLAKLGQTPMPLLSERKFVSRLQELGVIECPEARKTPLGSGDSFQPAPTVGKPASEIILEERR